SGMVMDEQIVSLCLCNAFHSAERLCHSVSITPPIEANGRLTETLVSLSGRFSAQLWRCCDVDYSITAFEVYDTNTQQHRRHVLSKLKGIMQRPVYCG